MPRGIGKLKELQVLKRVDLERSHRRVVEELAQLRQLRKLGVVGLERGQFEKLSASISQLSSLRSLKILIPRSDEAATGFLDSVSWHPEHLRIIKLEGWIGKLPTWVSSLHNLAKVTLLFTRLDDDSMVVLEELPNLLLLRLCSDSFVGAKLTFRSAKFPKLRELHVWSLDNVEELFFEERTLPELPTLEILCCQLKSGISGIEHLPRLKKLKLGGEVYVANLDAVQKQLGEHSNHPAMEVKDPEYQKEKEEFYQGTNSSGPPADEDNSSSSVTEEMENS